MNNRNHPITKRIVRDFYRYAGILLIFLISSMLFIARAQADDNRVDASLVEPDIIGGQEADIGEYPWQAVLQTSDSQGSSYLCGGSLIDPHWVMTAAHCVYDDQTGGLLTVDVVILGAHNIMQGSEVGRQSFGAAQVIIHPNYNPNTINHDIALIELDDAAQMTEYVSLISPVSSPEDDELMSVGTEATVSGWGQTGSGSSASSVLMEVSVPIVRQSTCQTAYLQIGGVVTNNMLCAGYSTGGKDTCKGDSGGPLIAPKSNGVWKQVGIVSWGYYPCAQPGYYGVYTRVANYYDWIMGNLGTGGTPQSTPTAPSTPTPKPTMTATPTKPATPTQTSTPTVTPGPSPTPFADLLENGDFESKSDASWKSSSAQSVDLITNASEVTPLSGDFTAQLGVVDQEESRLWQGLQLPQMGALYLSFDYAIASSDLGCFGDVGKIYIGQERILQFVLCSDTQTLGWGHHVLDITEYAGNSLNLQFYAHTNGSDPSTFYVDNVRVSSFLTAEEIAQPVDGVNDGGAGAPGKEITVSGSVIYLPLVSR